MASRTATSMAANNAESSHPFHWHYGDLEDKNFQVHGRSLLLVLIIFSVILICTLLCLYARWAWRYRQLAESSRQQFSISSDALAVQHGKLGLDSVALSLLPVFLYKSPASIRPGCEDPQCAICLSVFREDQKVKVLPGCDHSFHPDCIDKWLSEQPSCPLCRSSLATILATAV
ncbi:RING-H2 finger protein ATL66 [Nymphaea colorata]|uniref:RING-type E3 ubiquitin transferase n=1 Tax=Nymphaea colorata TaxID=210225 RepID=A0A5K0X557_9MAGN|nr:RING-H2 finger protein ATL66 [Nymphaea colorata]